MDKKICVYAIAKNEIKFVERWFDSVKEADYICVLDTGSDDGTFEKLKSLKIITKQKKYKDFRFDKARNDSMSLIPDDAEICVCIDLDEIFVPGWSNILKKYWNTSTTQARYRYTWNFNEDGSEGIVFFANKIHKHKLFKWKNPVHEILVPNSTFNQNEITIPQIQLNHHADNSKSRSSYLPLLELSIKENPNDDRNMHYLGREYMFYRQYNKAIETLKKHLDLPSATWKEERCASMRYIARCYEHLNEKDKQEEFLLRAILESPNTREPYFDLAVMYYKSEKYLKSIFIFEQMLKITKRELSYISSPACWSSLVFDYLSICYYHLKDYKKAISNVETAILMSNDERLKENRKLFIDLSKNP